MNFAGAIFDFDGVIVDTVQLHYLAWKELLNGCYGLPFDQEYHLTEIMGRKSFEVVQSLMPYLSSAEIDAGLEYKKQYYRQLLSNNPPSTFDSTINLIRNLLSSDVKVAIASSSRSVECILEQANIADLFDTIITSRDTKFGKPNPECFLKAAAALNLTPKQCVVFEDAQVGVKAAKAGGFQCVGIDRNDHPELYCAADLVVSDLGQVGPELCSN